MGRPRVDVLSKDTPASDAIMYRVYSEWNRHQWHSTVSDQEKAAGATQDTTANGYFAAAATAEWHGLNAISAVSR